LQVIKNEKKDLWYLDQLSDKGLFEPNHCLIYDACDNIVLIGKVCLNQIIALFMMHVIVLY